MIYLVRLPSVKSLTGRSRASIYKDMQDGLLPSPIKCGTRSVAWLQHEIEAVIMARVKGQSEDQIRALVIELESKRGEAA
ncbi:MAG: AlpA family phage regulatory protein [Syntrophobacteraceae bacterium]|jgi:prophage regulatory protein